MNHAVECRGGIILMNSGGLCFYRSSQMGICKEQNGGSFCQYEGGGRWFK